MLRPSMSWRGSVWSIGMDPLAHRGACSEDPLKVQAVFDVREPVSEGESIEAPHKCN